MALQYVKNNNLDELVKNGVSLVDFYADWCGPCKMIAPVVEELANEFNGTANIIKLDVDSNEMDAAKYGVMSIPTLILFKDGKPYQKVVGFQPKNVLKNWINTNL